MCEDGTLPVAQFLGSVMHSAALCYALLWHVMTNYRHVKQSWHAGSGAVPGCEGAQQSDIDCAARCALCTRHSQTEGVPHSELCVA